MPENPGPLLGGNPRSYWRLPFDERFRHHLPPGVDPEKCRLPRYLKIDKPDEETEEESEE